MSADLLNGRYRLEQELGRGGMSVVYRAHDLLLDRPVAVKVLRPGTADDESWKRVLAEARSAARLNHPNIVSIYDVGEGRADDGPSPYIVMELVDGRPLNAAPPREFPVIVAVAERVLEALAHAHDHGVIHRDLKPENILLTAGGQVKLMDFGLAQSVASRLTSGGAVVGTVFYIAPEQAMGRGVDGRADLYALGVVLYELVAGELPFVADNALAVVSLHLHAPPVTPRAHRPELTPAFESLILRLLAKRPEDRPAGARETLQLLRGVLGDGGQAAELSLLDRIVRGRLVGRERELAEAIGHYQRAIAGEEQVLLVTGEPGIGKTRLVRELLAHVEVTGGQAVSGECFAEGGAPFAPFAEILRRTLAERPGLAKEDPLLGELATFAPDLALRFPGIERPAELDPASQQQRAFEAFTFLLERLSAAAPLAVFLDDIHWADAGSLQLIHYLARRVRRLPILLVLTYREIEIDENPPFARLLQDLNRERLAERLKLGRLSREQTRQLLQAMFAEEITPDFLDGVFRESEGNPFFIEEICKSIIDSGKLAFEDGRWRRPSIADLEIPQSIRGAILTRVAKLPEAAREAMLMAAILGREFEFETLQRAVEMPEESLISALEAAEHAQLISETRRNGDVVFTFAHALIPSSLAEAVSVLRRRLLHRRAATAIEAAHPDAWEVLAYHWIEAGDDERAHLFSLRAGDRAYASLARAESVRHYRAALERWPEDDLEGRADTLAKLGDCLLLTATPGVGDVYGEALRIYTRLGRTTQIGDIERRFGRLFYESGDRRRAMEHYRRALEILEAGRPTPELAMALSSMSQMTMLASEYEESLAWGERAIALAADLDVEGVRIHALNNVGCSLCGLGQLERGLALLRESRDRAVAAGQPHDAARALVNVGDVHLTLGRLAEARTAYEELMEFAGRYRVVAFESAARERLVLVLWLLGQWDAALRLERAVRESGTATGLTRVWHHTTVARMQNDLGRPAEARRILVDLRDDAERNEELQTSIPFLTQLTRAARLIGDDEAGRDAVEGMLSRMDAVSFFDGSCGPALVEAVRWMEASNDGGQRAEAQQCLERLERQTRQMNPLDAAPNLAEVHAVLARWDGDLAETASRLEEAAEGWRTVGVPYNRAEALIARGKILAALGEEAAAQSPIHAARAILDDLGSRIDDPSLRETFETHGLPATLRSGFAPAD